MVGIEWVAWDILYQGQPKSGLLLGEGLAVTQHHYRTWLLFACLAATSGCAQFAVQPPTPAKNLDVSGMWEPRPGEHFYIILFGSQSTPKISRFTHSWATVIHTTDQGKGRQPKIESHTISWMPATLKIRPWSFHVEKGSNLALHETLLWALGNRQRISQWGPYECRPRLYYRALVQKEFLESGRVGYQAIDDIGEAARTGDGCDCIHAMTDMDPLYSRNRYPLIRFGESASRFVVRELRRRDIIVNTDQTHDWLNTALGLDSYPIIHRQYTGW
jgi:hypothetical protein